MAEKVIPEATQRPVENLIENPVIAEVMGEESFDADLVRLMRQEIELSKSVAVTDDLIRSAEQQIKSRYAAMQKKRREEIEKSTQARLTENDRRAVSAAAQREGLRSAAGDVRIVGNLTENEMRINQMEKQQREREAMEHAELERRAAALAILASRLDTMIRTRVSPLRDVPTVSECCRCASFDDTNFAKMCCLVACPYPGLCYVQNLVMQKLRIERERPGKPAFNVLYDSTGFAGLGLLTCCFGLAWNRERVHEKTESGKLRFFYDCLIFLCCAGQIPVLQDVLFSQRALPKVKKNFSESFWAVFNFRKLQNAWNCIGCCAATCCPFPALCLLQGYDVMATQEVLRSVTANPLNSASEKRSIILTYGALSCLTCCFGMAFIRVKVANAMGLDEYLMRDCLKNAIGCCFCSIIQEFYTVNAMRVPPKAEVETELPALQQPSSPISEQEHLRPNSRNGC